jgi:hypothetical protein
LTPEVFLPVANLKAFASAPPAKLPLFYALSLFYSLLSCCGTEARWFLCQHHDDEIASAQVIEPEGGHPLVCVTCCRHIFTGAAQKSQTSAAGFEISTKGSQS